MTLVEIRTPLHWLTRCVPLECDPPAKALQHRVHPDRLMALRRNERAGDAAGRSVRPPRNRFLDHHSGGNATRIGVFSLFYAIPGTYWHQMLSERRGPVFIEELQRLRYDIQVFRSTPIYSPEFDRTVFADVQLSRRKSDGERPVQWDRDLTDDFLSSSIDAVHPQGRFSRCSFMTHRIASTCPTIASSSFGRAHRT